MKNFRKCKICGVDNIPSQSFYCLNCRKLVDKASKGKRRIGRKVAAQALKLARRKGKKGFYCHYTDVEVLVDKKYEGSPRYINFDHRTPGKNDDIVISTALINDMKTDMSEEEFKNIVNELDRHFRNRKSIFNQEIFNNLKHYKRNISIAQLLTA